MGSIVSTKVTGSPQILMTLIKNCIKGEKIGLFNFSFQPITRKRGRKSNKTKLATLLNVKFLVNFRFYHFLI